MIKDSKYVPYILFAIVLLFAIFLRFYNFGQHSIYWMGDQGRDMLVARKILCCGHKPLVGPPLGVPYFFTPPNYFYFLAALLSIGGDIMGTAFLFQLVNLTSLILLFVLIRKLIDARAALIGALLFATSEEMVSQSRTIWQPQLVTLFIIIALYLLVLAFKKRRALFIWLSCTFYFVAMSTYPNSIPLAPFFLWQVIRYGKKIRGKSKKIFSYKLAILASIFSFLLIYSLQILFEAQNGFPTLATIMKPRIQNTVYAAGVSRVKTYLDNIEIFFGHLFGIRSLFEYSRTFTFLLTLNFIALIFFGIKEIKKFPARLAKKYKSAGQFIALPFLFLGSLALGWFRIEAHSHRSWAFLPFIYIILAFLGRLAFDVKNYWYKTATLLLLGIMIILNLLIISDYHLFYSSEWVPNTVQVADYIISDIELYDLQASDTTTFIRSPDDFYAYELTAISYFLQKKINYPIEFVSNGNELDRWTLMIARKPVLYLICRDYKSRTEAIEHCMNSYLKNNSVYELATYKNLNQRFQVFKLNLNKNEMF